MATLNRIICGDCLKVLPMLPRAACLIADPPDNLGVKYDGFTDRRKDYPEWLLTVVRAGLNHDPNILWLSHYYKHTMQLVSDLSMCLLSYQWDIRQFVWRFSFGQHRTKDCGNGYRPLLRFSKPGTKWQTDAIRIQSQRQRNGDKRAAKGGRVPDDVWEFPRVCGTFKEKRRWGQNQHPEALVERMLKISCKPGDSVIDAFAGTFTVARVCKRLGIPCTSIELSPTYCRKGAEELGIDPKEIEVP